MECAAHFRPRPAIVAARNGIGRRHGAADRQSRQEDRECGGVARGIRGAIAGGGNPKLAGSGRSRGERIPRLYAARLRRAAGLPGTEAAAQLEPFLREAGIAVCLLPQTRETEGIFCARNFAAMPKGAMIINVGRGKHVVEKDLIAALDSGQLSYAALDALWPEPLPPESPLWAHPKVTVMPHVARRPSVAQLVSEIERKIRSVQTVGRLMQERDKD